MCASVCVCKCLSVGVGEGVCERVSVSVCASMCDLKQKIEARRCEMRWSKKQFFFQ